MPVYVAAGGPAVAKYAGRRRRIHLYPTAEQKQSIDDPIELEKAADALPIEQVAKRWIVSSDPDEAVEKVGEDVTTGSTTWCARARPPAFS